LIVDVVEQSLRDLDRQIVFVRKRAERACHSTAGGIEHRRLSSRQTFRESSHEHRIHDRFGVTMRMNRNCSRPEVESKRVGFLRQ
jgi:hypothetical protein